VVAFYFLKIITPRKLSRSGRQKPGINQRVAVTDLGWTSERTLEWGMGWLRRMEEILMNQ
jgi:hypothetical protein